MAKKSSIFSVSSKAVDPALDALFSGSAGPVKAPEKSRYSELSSSRSKQAAEDKEDEEEEEEEEEGDDEELSSLGSDAGSGLGDESEDEKDDASEASESENEDSSEDEDQQEAAVSELATHARRQEKKRKRKQDELDDLESKYLNKLADDDDTPVVKRRKEDAQPVGEGVILHESLTKKTEDDSDSGSEIVHESLTTKDTKADEIEKAGRTVFLSNVSVEAITSRKAKKALLAHLSSVLDAAATPPQKIESIRFRSVAFSTAAVPKRAAYINKEVMDATTKSANAYAVYSTPAAVRAAVAQLNGTTVLDRHLRVDSVAHPAAVDHRRCVFVGNLGFVDDETVLNVKIDEETGKETTDKRKRTKVPMDVEEGLWRQFGERAGKVESVRVVRDSATRVGKGIAYVQFYDANSVEAALLLNGKKFPPMLPRELRVSRCKAPSRTARAMEKSSKDKVIADGKFRGKGGAQSRRPSANASQSGYVRKRTAEEQTLAGRAEKLLGRAAAGPLREKERLAGSEAARARIAKAGGRSDKNGGGSSAPPRTSGKGYGRSSAGPAPAGIKTPEAIVFEGRRASSRDGKPRDLQMGRKGSHKKGGVQKRPFRGKR